MPSAAIAWAGLAVLIFLYVLVYDLWAHYSKHLTMTAQFRNWLGDPIMGPVIFAVWVGLFVGVSYHLLIRGR